VEVAGGRSMAAVRGRWFQLILELWILANLFLLNPAPAQVLNIDQQIEVADLPSIVSPSRHSSDVLVTSLATIFHDPEVCCGKDSALEDSVERADPKSLQDVAARLNGRHLLPDGRSFMVKAVFFPPDQANAANLVKAFTEKYPLLMQWNSHIYVVHGLVYFWNATGGDPKSGGGGVQIVVHKFLLWDTRYSDSRRQLIFNRDTDDLGKVQSFLFVEVNRY
jgi:hypothetical protein